MCPFRWFATVGAVILLIYFFIVKLSYTWAWFDKFFDFVLYNLIAFLVINGYFYWYFILYQISIKYISIMNSNDYVRYPKLSRLIISVGYGILTGFIL